MDPHAFTLRRAGNVAWKPQTMLPLLWGKDDNVERKQPADRGVNVGDQPYEEVTVFFLDRPDAVPQPRAE